MTFSAFFLNCELCAELTLFKKQKDSNYADAVYHKQRDWRLDVLKQILNLAEEIITQILPSS